MASYHGFLSPLSNKATRPFRKALINSNFSRGPASLRRTATRPLFHWPGICNDLKVNNYCTFTSFGGITVFLDYSQGHGSQVKEPKWMGTLLLNRSKVGWFRSNESCMKYHEVTSGANQVIYCEPTSVHPITFAASALSSTSDSLVTPPPAPPPITKSAMSACKA